MKFRIISILLVGFMLLTLSPQAKNKKDKKEIGIQLWSVRKDMKENPEGTIEQLGRIGYRFVEMAGYKDGRFYGMLPAEFKTLVEANGMSVLSSHTRLNLPVSDEDWNNATKWWDQCIAAHKAVGAKYIIMPSMEKTAYQDLAVLKKYCDYFNFVGEKCNKAGLRFGYHNHANEFTTEFEGNIFYDYLLQNTDPKNVIFQLDLFWVYKGGKDATEYFKKYPGRFELFHVKDETELGASGQMDFKSVFKKSKKGGMKYYIVEIGKYNFDPLISVAKCYKYLNEAAFIKN